ncbi:MAG: ATP-binding cassette domain-containing protein, partial [Oceanidesulfovibrio sp.]
MQHSIEAPARTGPMILMDDIHLMLQGGSGPVNVLRGVSLSIAAGETVSVAGPSGSGKTTMLMVMSGLEKPTSGKLMVAGQDLTAMDEDGLARFRRGRV